MRDLRFACGCSASKTAKQTNPMFKLNERNSCVDIYAENFYF